MTATVLVLNPNSSAAVTEAVAAATDALTVPGVRFAVEQLDDGPPVIESDADLAAATRLVPERLRARSATIAAAVVACHGDPGVTESRTTGVPVLGIGETSFLAACALAGRFGLITLGPGIVARKRHQIDRCGLTSRCAAVEPTGTGVLHGTTGSPDTAPYLTAAERAIAAGAGALVLGCAGMVTLRDALQADLPVPVIEPVTVTCRLAAGVR